MVMYTENITTKVRIGTKEIAAKLAKDDGITLSEFVRLAVEDRVANIVKSVLIDRGFDEVMALSLLDCMGSDDVRDINGIWDITLAYRAYEGHVVEATIDDVERALSDVNVIIESRERGDVVTMQNGKEISDDNPLLIVAGYDKELGVLVIA